VDLTPHVLRHTHGTDLARHSWTAPLIAKRLGQSNASSADVYIHLADSDITAKYRETMGRES
jgi:integrase/recombinase XerD